MWGRVHTTSLLDNAGENAVWGTPWAPNEGVVDIPLSHASGSKVGIKARAASSRRWFLPEYIVLSLLAARRHRHWLFLTFLPRPP